jgi:uncharacterized protein YegL
MAYNRRLPVYLLVDCSESMAGPLIEAVDQGLNQLIAALRSDPMALEMAAISVITFSSRARQLEPLTDLIQFEVPKLRLGSGTAMGAALDLWVQCMDREVVRSTPERKGDYKPICFLLTDGEPTDHWETAVDRVRTTVADRRANLIAVACGDADPAKLRRATETVILTRDVNPEALKGFFKWVSTSVTSASQSLKPVDEHTVSLPELPAGFQEAERGLAERPASCDERFVFLHARCAHRRAFYLIRYERVDGGESRRQPAVYRGVASYPIEDFEISEQEPALKVSNQLLQNPPGCPYCENKIWAMCHKGHVHCSPMITSSVRLTCPWCGKSDMYQAASFDVGRGAG